MRCYGEEMPKIDEPNLKFGAYFFRPSLHRDFVT